MATWLLVCALLVSSTADPKAGTPRQPAPQLDAREARLQRVPDDYIRLYARDRLQDWRGLFLPTFVAGSVNDGS